MKTYQELMAPLVMATVAFLEEKRASGADSVIEKDVARVLNRFDGRPGGLARTVIQKVKVARPDLVWKYEEWSARDGIIYFAPRGEDGPGA